MSPFMKFITGGPFVLIVLGIIMVAVAIICIVKSYRDTHDHIPLDYDEDNDNIYNINADEINSTNIPYDVASKNARIEHKNKSGWYKETKPKMPKYKGPYGGHK